VTAFRAMIPEDRDFVVSTWSASYRMSPHAGLLSMKTYAEVMHREVERIIDHPTTAVIVADEPGETDHEGRPFVYGFIARRRDLPHMRPYVYYVYVKTPYRRGRHRKLPQAMATSLFLAANVDPRRPFTFACFTTYCEQLARKIPLAKWDPMPARFLP
jgi:hypothetical protein